MNNTDKHATLVKIRRTKQKKCSLCLTCKKQKLRKSTFIVRITKLLQLNLTVTADSQYSLLYSLPMIN